MPEEIQNAASQPSNASTQPASVLPSSKSGGKRQVILIAAAILGLLILFAVAVAWGMQQKATNSRTASKVNELNEQVAALKQQDEARKQSTGEAAVDKNSYQAVFLKEGQVYFGKITSVTDAQIVLEDIYYLKTDSTQIMPDPGSSTGGVSLVKLGNELHGPQDKMFIERKEVQFWENLKSDSQVSEAIVQYKKHNP